MDHGPQLFVRFLFQNEPWRLEAACRDLDDPKVKAAFFPERGYSHQLALDVCATCPVTRECADYADRTNSEYGVWGGQIRKRGRKDTDEAQDTQRQQYPEL